MASGGFGGESNGVDGGAMLYSFGGDKVLSGEELVDEDNGFVKQQGLTLILAVFLGCGGGETIEGGRAKVEF